jgi:hypothetical protein
VSSKALLWWMAKGLELVGLVLVLVGLVWSVRLGFEDQGLASMRWEFRGLLWGGGLFLAGILIERAIKAR